MSTIPRKSIFNFSDEERNSLRIKIEEFKEETEAEREERKKDFFKSLSYGLSTGKITMEECRDTLYYQIGMLDYDAYIGKYSSPEEVKQYLKKRARISAALQILEEDMIAQGLTTTIDKHLRVSETTARFSTLYHGTKDSNITEKELGKKDKNGIYFIRDGVTYWKTVPEEADNYRKVSQRDKNGNIIKDKNGKAVRVIAKGSQRLERQMNNTDEVRMIPATNGGMCFQYQEDFIRLCNEGIKYLICDPNTPDKGDFTKNDVLDIESYADFVRQRDASIERLLTNTILPNGQTLRMPVNGERYSDYIAAIERPLIDQKQARINPREVAKTEEQLVIKTKGLIPIGQENVKIKNTKKILAEDMKKYVQIILNEYGDAIPEERKEFLRGIEDYYSRITVKDSGTISMFATNAGIIMPKGAYQIFKYMRLVPGYGINKKHKSYEEGEIVNENTYSDYIKHVFVSGMSVEDFFRDTLLHETMHFCGAGGINALREGLAELKTRELAQKYGLRASRCGYPKEVDIANRFQKIIGVDITDKITFARNDREINEILQENCGREIAELFFEISNLMDKELKAKYDHSKFGGLLGPIKKARAYSKIDYSNIYEKLKAFEVTQNFNGDNFQKRLGVEVQSKNDILQRKDIPNERKEPNENVQEIDNDL